MANENSTLNTVLIVGVLGVAGYLAYKMMGNNNNNVSMPNFFNPNPSQPNTNNTGSLISAIPDITKGIGSLFTGIFDTIKSNKTPKQTQVSTSPNPSYNYGGINPNLA
ncbi:MAG: hypothetical protein ACKVOU_03690 [Cytophagales bacterium]